MTSCGDCDSFLQSLLKAVEPRPPCYRFPPLVFLRHCGVMALPAYREENFCPPAVAAEWEVFSVLSTGWPRFMSGIKIK